MALGLTSRMSCDSEIEGVSVSVSVSFRTGEAEGEISESDAIVAAGETGVSGTAFSSVV